MTCMENISPEITTWEYDFEIVKDGLRKYGFDINEIQYSIEIVKKIQKALVFIKMNSLSSGFTELEEYYFADAFCIYIGNYLRSIYNLEWKEESEDSFILVGENAVIDIYNKVFTYLEDENIESDLDLLELFNEDYAKKNGLKIR